MTASSSPNWITLLALLMIPAAIGIFFLLRKYAGLSREPAYLLSVGLILSTVVLVVLSVTRGGLLQWGNASNTRLLILLARGLCIMIAVPFAIRLYRKWLGGALSEAEMLPGTDGFRAWLSPTNLVMAGILALLLWLGFDIPWPAGLLLTCGALALWPLLNSLAPGAQSTTLGGELSVEREKVLGMLEAGKITAEESADLLNALGATTRAAGAATVPLTPYRRLVLLGAALVLLGFFLPWLVINPGHELNRTLGQIVPHLQAPGFPPLPTMGMETVAAPTFLRVQVAGGDIPHGLGWLTLFLAITAAAVPHFQGTIDLGTQRALRLLALASGSVIILYLLTQNFRFAGLGLVIAAAGYGLELIGTLREQRAAA